MAFDTNSLTDFQDLVMRLRKLRRVAIRCAIPR